MREEYDVMVAGHGAAGLVAAARLARSGLKVAVVGSGTSATALSTGRVLFPEDRPGARGPQSFLQEHGAPWGLFQKEGRRRAWTNLGTISAQSLSSEHDWLAEEAEVAAVGLVGCPDLDPDLLRLSAARQGARVVPYWTGPGRSQSPEGMVDALCAALRDVPQGTVVLPPLFPGRDHGQWLGLLERGSGRKVREAMTPLSLPGRQLQGCLEDGAAHCGCILLKGRRLVNAEVSGPNAVSAVLSSGLREVRCDLRALVLACGNLVGGGLVVDRTELREPVLSLGVREGKGKGLRSLPLRRALAAGVEVRRGRAAAGPGQRPGNIFVAGSMLPGMSYPLGKGLGDVILNAWETAEAVREAL